VYAIVDIETTGGHASAHGITEIAIILHNGLEEEGRYESLVNPGMPVPRYITAMTGITNEMLIHAPRFEAIASNIFNLLQGRVFVAHNVNFDYSFIKHHLSESGFEMPARKLCTVRMARKIIPGLARYSLGNLSRHFGIINDARHRAMGDAAATARLFSILLANDKEGVVSKMLKPGSGDTYLPMHLPVKEIEDLPYTPGVYYFHDQKGKIIYVGKAVNLRKRVTSHFSNNAPSRRKQELNRLIHHISFQETGSDFMACLLESIEIRKRWPAFNTSQKRFEQKYGLYVYEGQSGALRLVMGTKRKGDRPVYSFGLVVEGQALLRQLIQAYQLCPRLCFLQSGEGPCEARTNGQCLGICEGKESPDDYNRRVLEAVDWLRQRLPSFAVLEKGRSSGERCIALMEKGSFYGFAYLDSREALDNWQQLKERMEPLPDNEFVRSLMIREASRYPEKILKPQP
jgi:DNA polymerase-3 subunit epsilon